MARLLFTILLWPAAALAASPGLGLLTNTDGTVTLSNDLAFIRFARSDGRIYDLRAPGGWNFVGGGKPYMDLDANVGAAGTDLGELFLGPAVYSVVANTPSEIEVSFRNPNFGVAPGLSRGGFDVDLRYRMTTNDNGFYVYTVWRHGAGMPDASIGQMRVIARTADVFTHRFTNTNDWGPKVPDAWLTNAIFDSAWTVPLGTPGVYGRDQSNTFAVLSKYDWGEAHEHHLWQGMANSTNGLWMLTPSMEYYNGGPTKGSIMLLSELWEVISAHSGGAGVTLATNQAWEKIFGPFFICFSSGTSATQQWRQVEQRAEFERAAWPYAWVRESETTYPRRRGAVSGTLKVVGHSTANALMVLAQPDAGGYWQMQDAGGYQFWSRADAAGVFAVSKVRPGAYALFAQVPGVVGVMQISNVVVGADATNDLGAIYWNPPHYEKLLWRVGTPDLTTAEFRFGNLTRRFGLWWQYLDERGTNDLNFYIGRSVESNDWYYAQELLPVNTGPTNGIWVSPKWNVFFNLASLPPAPVTLTIDLAGSINSGINVFVNDTKITPATGIYTPADAGLYRDSIRNALYSHHTISFNPSLLRAGSNSISLTLRGPGGADKPWTGSTPVVPTAGGVMYDCVQLEAGALVTGPGLPPWIASLTVSGTTVVGAGSDGPPDSSYYLLASTNVALAPSQWVTLATNQFDANGNFIFTNLMTSSPSQVFYRLRLP